MGGSRRYQAALLLAGLIGGCAAPEAPEWTWVADGWDRYAGLLMAPAGQERVAVLRRAPGFTQLDLVDGQGATVWSRRVVDGADGVLHPRAFVVGGDGMIYLGGAFTGTVSFGGGSAALSTRYESCEYLNGPGPCSEAFVAAYDGAGDFRWVWHVPGTHAGEVTQLAPSPDGVVLAADIWNRVATAVDHMAPSPARGSSVVAKLDPAGNEVWRYRDPTAADLITTLGMAIDDSGAILLSDWYTFEGPDDLTASFGLVRLGRDGQEVWRRDVPGGGTMALTADGDVILVGQFNFLGVEQVGNFSLFVHRHEGASGEILWRRFLGDWQTGQAYAMDVDVDPAGDVILLGFINGPTVVGPSTLVPEDGAGYFVARLDGEDGGPQLGVVWGWDAAYAGSLAVLGRDDLIIAGGFEGALPVGDGRTVVTPPNLGGVFVHRGNPFAD